MNYDKIKRTGILFLLGIGAITSLSCNDNDNANFLKIFIHDCFQVIRIV